MASEGKLDQDQIKSVIKIASKTYPLLDDKSQHNDMLKTDAVNFLNKHITDDKINAGNVFSYLK